MASCPLSSRDDRAGEDQQRRQPGGCVHQARSAGGGQHGEAGVDEEQEAKQQLRPSSERRHPGEAEREQERQQGGDERGLVEEIRQAERLRRGGLARALGLAKQVRHGGKHGKDEEDRSGDGTDLSAWW